MISSEHFFGEVEKYEKLIEASKVDNIEVQKGILKMLMVNAKLLHNLRTNSVRIMDFFKIPKVKARDGKDNRDEKVEETVKKS